MDKNEEWNTLYNSELTTIKNNHFISGFFWGVVVTLGALGLIYLLIK